LIYWDNTAKECTTTVGSNKLIGTAALAATNPSSTGTVRLNGAFIA
jgi:predicted RecA/RadA family phage recombinase